MVAEYRCFPRGEATTVSDRRTFVLFSPRAHCLARSRPLSAGGRENRRVGCQRAGRSELSVPRPRPPKRRGGTIYVSSSRQPPPARYSRNSWQKRTAGRDGHTNPPQRCARPAACRHTTASAAANSQPTSRTSSPSDHGPDQSRSNSNARTTNSTSSLRRPADGRLLR